MQPIKLFVTSKRCEVSGEFYFVVDPAKKFFVPLNGTNKAQTIG